MVLPYLASAATAARQAVASVASPAATELGGAATATAMVAPSEALDAAIIAAAAEGPTVPEAAAAAAAAATPPPVHSSGSLCSVPQAHRRPARSGP